MPVTMPGCTVKLPSEPVQPNSGKDVPQATGPDPAKASKRITNWNADRPGNFKTGRKK